MADGNARGLDDEALRRLCLALAPLRFLLLPEHLLACQVASSGGLDSGGGETLGGGFRCRLGLFCSPGRGFRDRFVLVC